MGQNTRKDPRAKVLSMTVRYRSATLGEFIEHHSYDVSRGGMFIKTSSPFPAGTLLKFEVKIADEQRVMQGVGRVVWKRDEPGESSDEPAGMGIKFIKIDEASRTMIERLLESRRDLGPGAYERSPESTRQPLFPELPREDVAPEDRTVMKPASELLAEALRKTGEAPPPSSVRAPISSAHSSPGAAPVSTRFEPVRPVPQSLAPPAPLEDSVEDTGAEPLSVRSLRSEGLAEGSAVEQAVGGRPVEESAPRSVRTASTSSRSEHQEEEGGGGRAFLLLLAAGIVAAGIFVLTKQSQQAEQGEPPQEEQESAAALLPQVEPPSALNEETEESLFEEAPGKEDSAEQAEESPVEELEGPAAAPEAQPPASSPGSAPVAPRAGGTAPRGPSASTTSNPVAPSPSSSSPGASAPKPKTSAASSSGSPAAPSAPPTTEPTPRSVEEQPPPPRSSSGIENPY